MKAFFYVNYRTNESRLTGGYKFLSCEAKRENEQQLSDILCLFVSNRNAEPEILHIVSVSHKFQEYTGLQQHQL